LHLKLLAVGLYSAGMYGVWWFAKWLTSFPALVTPLFVAMVIGIPLLFIVGRLLPPDAGRD